MANIHIVLKLKDQYDYIQVYFLIFRFVFYSAEVPYPSNFCQIRFKSLRVANMCNDPSLCYSINSYRLVY